MTNATAQHRFRWRRGISADAMILCARGLSNHPTDHKRLHQDEPKLPMVARMVMTQTVALMLTPTPQRQRRTQDHSPQIGDTAQIP